MSSSSEKNFIVHLQSEIELLKKALVEKSREASLIYERKAELEESILVCEDKFERLYKSHRKVLAVNQNLEEKLLKSVDRNSGEKAELIGDCATLNLRLSQANINILQYQREIERYKQDIALAIHLLQCNPENSFITPSIKSLPIEIQSKLSSYMRREMNSTDENSKGYQRIPTCDPSMSFSPLSSSHGSHKNELSPIAVSKFLEDELKMSSKHCETCCCTLKDLTSSDVQRTVGIQTDLTAINCLRCNLNSPSHQNNNSSYLKKLRSSDSVFSECNLSDYTNSNERKTTPPKKDDLTINPILSHSHLAHHRMCERTKNMNASAQRRNTFSESVKNEQQQLPSINSSTPQLHRASSKDLKNEEIKSSSNKAKNNQPQKSPSNVGSSNDLNGTKIFENYNKDLLKFIKNKNLKVVGPRMCALRIQDDTIYVDSASDEVRSIPYSRRRTLVDDDLIENEENGDLPINLNSSRSSIIMSTVSNVDDEIFSTNKTDSEKFNEFKKELHSSCNINDSSHVEEIICEGDTTSIADSLNENAIMKHQRVAEWIQKSSIINLPPDDNSQKLSTPVYENKNVILEKLIDIDDDNDDEPKVKENTLGKEKNGSDDREKIDLLQMEYNVKQFLLKQKSVYADLHYSKSDDVNDDGGGTADEIADTSHYVKRTETNL